MKSMKAVLSISTGWPCRSKNARTKWKKLLLRRLLGGCFSKCARLKLMLQTFTMSITTTFKQSIPTQPAQNDKLEMWANAQRDGRPAGYMWRPLFNAAKFGWHPLLECRAVTLPRRETRWNLQGALTNETISAASGPKFTILCEHVEQILLLNKFFSIVDMCLSCEDIARQICGMVPRWRLFMVALCNRADHYIFALWFLSSSSFFFPRLISAVGDWMSTILLHMAWS